jgi:hypothetical protein
LSSEQDTTEHPDDDRIKDAKRKVDRDNLVLGRELYIAFSTGDFKKDGGFTSFEDYAISRGIDPWRARRLRRIFKKFNKDLGVPFERMLDIGHERLKAIETVVNRGNRDLWLSRAKELEFPDLMRKIGENKPAKKTREKRKVIKHEAGSRDKRYTPEDAAALIEGIEDDRLKPSADGKTVVGDEVIYARTIYLIGDQNTVFDTAIGNMERRTGSTKLPYLLTSCLEEQLAHEATRSLNDDGRMHYFMEVLERRYKGKLLWVKDKKVAAKLAEMIKQAEVEVQREQDEKDQARASD